MSKADPNPRHLDDVDRRILECLSEDGRMTSTLIGHRMNLSEKTIRRRMRRLGKERGLRMVPVVSGDYTDAAAHGYLGLAVESARIEHIAERLQGMSEIRMLAHTDGMFDLIAEAITQSPKRMKQLVNTITRLKGVRRVESCAVHRVAKTVLDRHPTGLPDSSELSDSSERPPCPT